MSSFSLLIEPTNANMSSENFERLISKSGGVTYTPTVSDLLQAFTLPSSGEEFNMERLEVLGDVFLKYSIGVLEFCRSVLDLSVEEGQLSQNRSRVVGNKNLFHVAIRNNFAEIINARKLEPHLNFMAPRLCQKDGLEEIICQMDTKYGKIMHETNTTQSLVGLLTNNDIQRLSDGDINSEKGEELMNELILRQTESSDATESRPSRYSLREYTKLNDKSLADVVEACIGCFLERCGQTGALMIMQYLGVEENCIFDGKDLPCNAFLSLCNKDRTTETISRGKLDHLLSKIDFKKVEDVLGYTFKEKSFLLQAFTHSSYIGNTITPSYERLEFLGDGILDFLITCHLYVDSTIRTPGEITELRSALVQNNVSDKMVYIILSGNVNSSNIIRISFKDHFLFM